MSQRMIEALVKEASGLAIVKPIPCPQLEEGYMLVRTHAVALNPADWTDIDEKYYVGCVIGVDYAGVVHQTNSGSKFKVGDRVCGVGHGCNQLHPERGCFATIIIVKETLQMKIPDSISFQDASGLGVGMLTGGMGLFHEMSLTPPAVVDGCIVRGDNAGRWILVYGGSSATGSIAIQLAKLAGLRVVSTCSPRNFDLVRGAGADVVLDYHDSKISTLIAESTSNTLQHAFDTIATDETAAICAEAFRKSGISFTTKATYACTLDPNIPADLKEYIEKKFFLGYTLFGEAFDFEGEHFPASQEDYQFATSFIQLAEKLLHAGQVRNHPIKLDFGGKGLSGLLTGLDLLRQGNVSGQKLVYTMHM